MTAQTGWTYERGDEDGDVTYDPNAAVDPGADARLSWNSARSREDVIIGIETLMRVILRTPWPPAV